MVTLDRWRWVTIGSLVVAFAASVVAAPADTAIARGFFVVTVVGGIVAGAGLRGRRTQALSATILAALVVGQRTPGQSVADPPSPDWKVALASADDVASVRMRLDTPEFRVAASRADRAWAYVCAEGIGIGDGGLILNIRTDTAVATAQIGPADAIGARPRPEQGGMYRTPIDLNVLRDASQANLSLQAPRGPVRVCGTHSIRPSWGGPTSALIRGGITTAPSPKGPGRWVIEIRLVGPDDRLLLAWY